MKPHRTIFSLLPLLTLGLLLVPQVSSAFILEAANETAQEVVYFITTSFFGMFVWFGAALLNFGINQFVIGFGDVYNNSGIGVAVNNTWVIIRDFVNLGFIFGLVYIGLRMILDSNNSNTRRWLANLIIAALLVNFSLFATKFVVDLSNRLATEIACAGLTYDTNGNENVSDSYCRGGLYKIDAGSALMARMGLVTLFSQGDSKPDGTGWNYILGTAVLFMVTAFVFIAGGIMLFIRFAVLNLYLVFSAVMFIGWVIPGFPDQMRGYWKGFLSRAFFAPLYLMMLYFSFKIIDGLQVSIRPQGEGETGTSFASPNWQKTLSSNPADNPTDATLGTLPFFVLICIFLMASLVIAQKLGADGASFAQKTAGRATAGLLGRIGRNTAGRGANRLANSEYFKDMSANGKNVFTRGFARGTLAAGGYGAAASYDPRGIKGVSNNKFGIQTGDAQKGGFAKVAKDRKEKDKKAFGEDGLGFVDITTPEGQEKVMAKSAELTKQKEKEKAEKEKAKESLATVKTLSERSVEDIDTEAEFMKGATKTFAEELNNKRSIFKAGKNQDGSGMSIEAKQKLAAEIAKLEENDKNNNAMLAQLSQARDIAKQRESIEKDMKKDDEAAEKARENGDYNGYNKAVENRKKRQEKIDQIGKNLDKDIKKLEVETSTLGDEINNKDGVLTKQASAQVKYSRQIAVMNRKRESILAQKYVAGPAGFVGGALGTLSLAGGIVGLSELGTYGTLERQTLKELEKEYGKDGMKKANKEKETAAMKALIAAQKEETSGGEEPKKESGDDK